MKIPVSTSSQISPTLEVVKAFQSVITKEKEEVEVGAKTNIHFGSLHIHYVQFSRFY